MTEEHWQALQQRAVTVYLWHRGADDHNLPIWQQANIDRQQLVAEMRLLRDRLAHARHSANANYAGWALATNKVSRPLAGALWRASAPHCEDPASDGWEVGIALDGPDSAL